MNNSVNPLYYVTFTTCTLLSSFMLYRSFNTSGAVNTLSLLCGFLTIFAGVYLLNLSREDPDGLTSGIKHGEADGRGKYAEVDGIPTDGITGLQTRLSMQARRSIDGENVGHGRTNSWSLRSPITGGVHRRSQENLMYDLEAHSLTDLAEDSDESSSGNKRTSFDDTDANHRANGQAGNSRQKRVSSIGVNAGATKSFDKLRR